MGMRSRRCTATHSRARVLKLASCSSHQQLSGPASSCFMAATLMSAHGPGSDPAQPS